MLYELYYLTIELDKDKRHTTIYLSFFVGGNKPLTIVFIIPYLSDNNLRWNYIIIVLPCFKKNRIRLNVI